MKPTGFKIAVVRKDGEVTTWHDVFDRPAEDIIRSVVEFKQWEGGVVTDAYLEFDNNGEYYKIYLDAKRLTKLLRP
jgi:hypothetical protein